MCGIAGATGPQAEWIAEAIKRLGHRGPDRSSVYADADVALGHARLAIIDLSRDADQPMFNADRSLAVVFNGELYNFMERRAELTAAGHHFRTRSDTEVLLKLYELHGEACLDLIKGMFAFSIWDFRRRRLFAARDRMGEKPLYYTQLSDGPLLFASEIKALLAHPAVSRDMDPGALDDYLTYLYVPGDRTIFRGISSLPPGHSLVWERGRLAVRRYWRLPRPVADPGDDVELSARIEGLLRDSVRGALIADVRVGVFLSGGIDSSSIVAMAAEQTARLKTFTVVFDGEGAQYDERTPARMVAERFGTEHHELLVSGDNMELLSETVRHFDQPFGNPTALLTYEMSRVTRKHVTVVLGGDGGDEVFAGYPRYGGIVWAERYRHLPLVFRRAMARASTVIPESTSGRHAFRRAKEFLAGAARTPEDMYLGWICYSDRAAKAELYTDAFRSRVGEHRGGEWLRRLLEDSEGTFLDRAIACDLSSFLPHNVLEYGDKMSMAHGLELRLPFLDADLVTMMAAVPAHRKAPGGRLKHLLKRAMAGRLPAAILTRAKKGFNPPMGIWIANQWRKKVDEYLGEEQVRARGYFRPEAIARMRALHDRHARDYSLQLWALLVLEEWHRQYVE